MTLFRQLAFLVTAAFILLFVVITIDSTKQASVFLQGQIKTTAKDSATLLGMAISNTDAVEDSATLDTLFNAVFDSGYYSSLRMLNSDGDVVQEKSRNVVVENVPLWFIDWVELPEATGRANIMNGWSMFGALELTIHPGYAYASLYKNLMSTLIWFSVLFILVLILLWCLLHIVLKPLKAVNEQADAIGENRFIQQEEIPATLELRSVVSAMNRMVKKVQGIFVEHEATLARYHDLLYTDHLTGLANRRATLSELDTIASEGGAFNGSVALIKLSDLDVVRERYGYVCADEVVRTFVAAASDELQHAQVKQFSRLNDDEFSIILSEDPLRAEIVVSAIFLAFKADCEQGDTMFKASSVLRVNAGMTEIHSGEAASHVLSTLDLALAQACAEGNYQIQRAASNELSVPEGKMEWRHWFQSVLDEKRFYLVKQDVLDAGGRLEHREVFVRVKDDKGQVVPAGVFVPMATALGYGNDIDDAVFELVKQAAATTNDDVPFALNLSPAFFAQLGALDKLKLLLQWFSDNNQRIQVEANYSAFSQYKDAFLKVSALVRNMGQIFGIDHLELSRSAQALQEVRPNYAKINARVLGDLSNAAEADGYRALRSLTSTLDIQLIAVGVEDKDVYERLVLLNIDAVQGNLLAVPEEL